MNNHFILVDIIIHHHSQTGPVQIKPMLKQCPILESLHSQRSSQRNKFLFYIQWSNCSSNFFSCHLLLKTQHPISCHLSFASNTKPNFLRDLLLQIQHLRSCHLLLETQHPISFQLSFARNPVSNFFLPFFSLKPNIQVLATFLLLETQHLIFFIV